ncbi:MAG: benzoyl-CoA reductase subunit A [Planctomycetes bacterium]|nr:benzoyl-CoA reductase subunit A [Planctomycetota bacterium]
MKCWIGIDLGSTTTKSVILDESGRAVGRGITNSRSNYETACNVARIEALADARLGLCAAALPPSTADGALVGDVRAAFLADLQREFRLAWHLARLRGLWAHIERETPAVEKYFSGVRLGGVLAALYQALVAEAPSLFAPGAAKRSDFFRDTATSRYHALATGRAKAAGVPFEALMAAFDKAIIKAENEESDFGIETGASEAAQRALAKAPLSAAARGTVLSAMRRALGEPFEVVASVGTGYGRATLPFPKEQIRSEILCHGLGAHAMFPRTRTVLDIGGQDTKAIQVDEQGLVTGFQMNDRCAAGCGRYLGYIADEMNLGLHELGPLAQQSTRPVKINSTCTVFAGAEIRDRLTLGQRREDILAGLHRAVILRAMSLLARSGGIKDEFTFTGGVAKNVTAVQVLEKLVRENYGERRMNVSADSIYTGALGAALFAQRPSLASQKQELVA